MLGPAGRHQLAQKFTSFTPGWRSISSVSCTLPGSVVVPTSAPRARSAPRAARSDRPHQRPASHPGETGEDRHRQQHHRRRLRHGSHAPSSSRRAQALAMTLQDDPQQRQTRAVCPDHRAGIFAQFDHRGSPLPAARPDGGGGSRSGCGSAKAPETAGKAHHRQVKRIAIDRRHPFMPGAIDSEAP